MILILRTLRNTYKILNPLSISFNSIKLFLLVLGLASLAVLPTHLAAQAVPSCSLDFDGDDFSDSTGNYDPGTMLGNLGFTCGVGENSRALDFTGAADSLILDRDIKGLFDETFSLSFSFWLEPSTRSYTLFAIQDSCELDSSLIISYSNVIQELKVQLSTNIASSLVFTADLNLDRCWHDLILVRANEIYSFYLDGNLVETEIYTDDFGLGSDFDVTVGWSDCVPLRDEYFNGRIDDLKIYDSAIGLETIAALDEFPDQIISPDTTLFEGDSYDILTGISCASTFTWTPTSGLNNASILEPVATPSQTTTYYLEFDHGTCTTIDSVTIFIVKENDVDCSNILLPTAFTPNGDMLNDTYGISNKFIISDLKRFEIYDRWGMKLFDTVDKNQVWDGTYLGDPLMPSTYVYKIEYECQGNILAKSGRFNLIK